MKAWQQAGLVILVSSAVLAPVVCAVEASADNGQWCAGKDPTVVKDRDVVCVDLTNGNRDVLHAPPRQILPINTGLRVYVFHPGNWQVKASLGGTPGVAEPVVTTAASAIKPAVRTPPDASQPPPPPDVTSTFLFSPRLAGPTPLTISWQAPGSADAGAGGGQSDGGAANTLPIDLQVESLSWGAVRLGVGTVFGDTVGKGYKAQTAAGSSQTEIVQTDNLGMGFEAVLGLSPYVLDVLTCAGNGRSYTGGCNRYVAPYIGFGIVGASSTASVQTFDSIYLGLELAFSSTYSLAGTFVARQRSELGTGYHVGSPVDSNTTFTRNATGYGFGLVLNVTPDFFTLPTPSSGGSK